MLSRLPRHARRLSSPPASSAPSACRLRASSAPLRVGARLPGLPSHLARPAPSISTCPPPAPSSLSSSPRSLSFSSRSLSSSPRYLSSSPRCLSSSPRSLSSSPRSLSFSSRSLSSSPRYLSSSPRYLSSSPRSLSSSPRSLSFSSRSLSSSPRSLSSPPRSLPSSPRSLPSSPRYLSSSPRPATTTPLPPASPPSRLTVCLDLDETLVYSEVGEDVPTSFMERGAERARFFAQQRRISVGRPADFEVDLPYLEAPMPVYKRPELDDFLDELSRTADVVLWTTAAESYAFAMHEHLDPRKTRFAAVLTRSSCFAMGDGTHSKDLQLLGRPLERTVLVDDTIVSFLMQPDNAVPTPPYFGCAEDRALPMLLPILQAMEDMPDVRETLRRTYKMETKLQEMLKAMRAAA